MEELEALLNESRDLNYVSLTLNFRPEERIVLYLKDGKPFGGEYQPSNGNKPKPIHPEVASLFYDVAKMMDADKTMDWRMAYKR